MKQIERVRDYKTVVTIPQDIIIPLSIEWHRLTNFKNIGKVETYYPAIYADWERKGWIPAYVK